MRGGIIELIGVMGEIGVIGGLSFCAGAAFAGGVSAGFAFGLGVFLRFAVGLFVESEEVFVGYAVFKVDDGGGVDGYAEIAGLEVEVCAGAASGVASEGYGVACLYELVRLDEEAAEVAVDGLKSVIVADYDVVAVAAAFVFGEADFSGESRADGVAYLEFEVNAVVHASEA